jgi:hypothetical protein
MPASRRRASAVPRDRSLLAYGRAGVLPYGPLSRMSSEDGNEGLGRALIVCSATQGPTLVQRPKLDNWPSESVAVITGNLEFSPGCRCH